MSEKWKKVNGEIYQPDMQDHLHYIKVPGGFIYRNIYISRGTEHVNICFVPFAIRESRIQNTPEELDQIESMLFQGVQTHASILRCEAKLKELEARTIELEKIAGYEYRKCEQHAWEESLLMSNPPQKRCYKCGFTVIAC